MEIWEKEMREMLEAELADRVYISGGEMARVQITKEEYINIAVEGEKRKRKLREFYDANPDKSSDEYKVKFKAFMGDLNKKKNGQ